MKLYLASVSPRRREILRTLGLPFHALKPSWSEPLPGPGASAERYATGNARGKALSVLGRVKAGFVIGVDTVVVLDDTILGKPETPSQARAMLRMLSGRTHAVVSGVAVARKPGTRVFTGSEASRVTFRKLTERRIRAYIASKEPFDKAGAYAIQGRAGKFVTAVSGCYLNVVGLPVFRLLVLLERSGYRARSNALRP